MSRHYTRKEYKIGDSSYKPRQTAPPPFAREEETDVIVAKGTVTGVRHPAVPDLNPAEEKGLLNAAPSSADCNFNDSTAFSGREYVGRDLPLLLELGEGLIPAVEPQPGRKVPNFLEPFKQWSLYAGDPRSSSKNPKKEVTHHMTIPQS